MTRRMLSLPLYLSLCATLTVMVACLLVQSAAFAVDDVLDADTENDKTFKINRMRKSGISDGDLIKLIRSERNDNTVFLAMGVSLEANTVKPKSAAGLLLQLAGRKGGFGRACAMAAFSPGSGKIIDELMAGTKGHHVAAGIIAAFERAEAYERGDLPTVGGPYNPQKYRDHVKGQAETTAHLKTLLGSRKKEVMELALLAIGFKQDESLAEDVTNLKVIKDTKVQAAWQYAMARLGKPLDEKLLTEAFTKRGRSDFNFNKLNPKLSSYEIAGPAAMYACWAAGAAKNEKLLPHVHKALDSRDYRVSFDAAVAMEQIGHESSVPVLFKKLNSTRDWPIKVATLSAIGAIPLKTSFEPLMNMFAKENGRIRQDLNYAMASICGEQHGTSKQEWYSWWDENQRKFKVDPAKTQAYRNENRVQDATTEALTSFYGAGIISSRAVFVLDTSNSMKGDKIENLKSTMKQTLELMPDYMLFNIVDFGGVVNVMFSSMRKASAKSEADKEIDYFELTGGTRTFDAIERGVQESGMDTAVYLSDGSPVGGQYQDWSRIRRAMNLYNKHRPVAMYTIYFTGGGKKAKKPKGNKGNKKKGGKAPMTHKGMTPYSYQNWGLSLLPD